MARYVMILRRARYITRGIGRDGPWKSILFLGPEIATSEARAFWAQKRNCAASVTISTIYICERFIYPTIDLSILLQEKMWIDRGCAADFACSTCQREKV